MTEIPIDKQALEAALGRAADFLVGVNMQPGTSPEYRTLAAQSHVAVRDAIALIAALPSTTDAVGVTVRVKPLEWASEPPYSVARVLPLRLLYSTEAIWDDGAFQYVELSGATASGRFATVAEAKAAAQADYTARIVASLNIREVEPVACDAPSPQQHEAWVRRARSFGAEVNETPFGTVSTFRYLDQLIAFASPTTSPHAPEGVRDDALEEAAKVEEPETIKTLRHECAASGPCSENGDGCVCSVGELVNRHNFIVGASVPIDARPTREEHRKALDAAADGLKAMYRGDDADVAPFYAMASKAVGAYFAVLKGNRT